MTVEGVFDFGDGLGPVQAYRRLNPPDDSLGGWVSHTASVSSTAYIGPDALVYGFARVTNARIEDRVRVSGSAHIFGFARVCGEVHVSGSAKIPASALIEKPEDVRFGEGWTAYRTESEMRLYDHRKALSGSCSTRFSSWDELPRLLHQHGLISTMEYLAQTLELEPTQPETT